VSRSEDWRGQIKSTLIYEGFLYVGAREHKGFCSQQLVGEERKQAVAVGKFMTM